MSDLDRLHDNCVDAKALNQDRHLDELYELLTRMVALQAAAATPTRPAPVASTGVGGGGGGAPPAPTITFHSSEGLTGGGHLLDHPPPTPIRDEFAVHLLSALDVLLPGSRERSRVLDSRHGGLALAAEMERCHTLVITHLQEAAFWAKRAIAVRPENQSPTRSP